MASKQEFLAELPIFADLSESALEAVAQITSEYAFQRTDDKEAVIAYQRDVANGLYIVKEGRLYGRVMDNSGKIVLDRPETRAYAPGEYFNDLWLFVPTPHPATVKGSSSEGRVLVIDGPAFVRLLEAYPAVIDDLAPRDEDGVRYGLSDAGWAEAQKLKLRGRVRVSSAAALLPEERLEFMARRSHWILLGRLLAPMLLVLAAAVILAITPSQSGLERVIKVSVPTILTLIAAVWFGLRLIDFRADYFLITNRHLTHHEFDLRHFRIRLVKIPISQVQTVEIQKPSLIANVFNIGTARVTTAAIAGIVLFDNIDQPERVKEVLERLTGLYRAAESAQTQAVMRQTLEKHFGVAAPLNSIDGGGPPPNRRPRPEGLFAGLRRRYGWRVEEGNTITYRKSLFILLRQIGWPLLVFIALGVVAGLGLYLQVAPWLLALLFFGGSFINSLWFFWQLENWRNDIFQLTDRFVIDIDRLPFGFGESRKQAAISNIQNVDATRPGFFPTLFNYGFVSIDTAGSKSDIVFDYVPNPEVIQNDIFQRLDESRRQQRIKEGSMRREEYAVLLDVYRQAMEQGRIPQRTPTGAPEEYGGPDAAS